MLRSQKPPGILHIRLQPDRKEPEKLNHFFLSRLR